MAVFSRSRVRRMAASAVFLSIALVLKTCFSFYIPLFGQNGMSVGVSGVFSMMPSILFGPAYGAAVSALSDLMGYLLKPTGAFMPLLTLTAALGGALRGFLWRALGGAGTRGMRVGVLVLSLALIAAGAASAFCIRADGLESYYQSAGQDEAALQNMSAISRMLISRTASARDPAASLATYALWVTAGPLCCGALALALMGADMALRGWMTRRGAAPGMLPMLICVVASGLIVTTINTVILRETLYQSWKLMPFFVIWVPRAVEEIVGGTVKVCLMSVLLSLWQARFAR